MIDIPVEWPGEERVRVILAALRLSGTLIPNCYYHGKNIPYDKLPTKKKREYWKNFRLKMYVRGVHVEDF